MWHSNHWSYLQSAGLSYGSRDSRSPRENEYNGFFVEGLAPFPGAVEVSSIFRRFGSIRTIDTSRHLTFVGFDRRSSFEEAIKHDHFYKNSKLTLLRRNPDSGILEPLQKLVGPIEPQTMIDHFTLMEDLKSYSIEEQVEKLKHHVLAGDMFCERVTFLICSDIVKCLKKKFVINNLFAFGSMVTGLAFKGSDIDVCADIKHVTISNLQPKQKIGQAVTCFHSQRSCFTSVVPIRNAKIPILKAVHTLTGISCDISFGDPLGYWNSRLLRLYLHMNERFFDVMVVIKYWAHVNEFVNCNKFSNYAISILVISFLQSLRDSLGEKIVPSVHDLQKHCCHRNDTSRSFGHWYCDFDEHPRKVTLPNTHQFSVLGLLKGFFSYVVSLPFKTHVVSILTGELLHRNLFEEDINDLADAFKAYKTHIQEHPEEKLFQPEHDMVIHDPFRLNHNLTGRVCSSHVIEFLEACQKLSESHLSSQGNICDSTFDISYILHRTTCAKRPRKRKKHSDRGNIPFVLEWTSSSSSQKNPYEEEFKLLCKIFTNILHFDVKEVDDDDDNLPLIKKKASEFDLSSEKWDVSRTIICTGHKSLWLGRGQARKKLSLGTAFEHEVRISDEILKQNVSDRPIHFHCCMRANITSKCLHLRFLNKCDQNGSFNCLVTFLQVSLRKWFETFLKSEVCGTVNH